MRRVASIVLLVLAGVMFPVLVLSNWAGSNLYNSDSFSERAVAPLNSQAVRTELARRLTAQLVQAGNQQATSFRPAFELALEGVIDTDTFKSIFRNAVRRTHQAIIQGNGGGRRGLDLRLTGLWIAAYGLVVAAAAASTEHRYTPAEVWNRARGWVERRRQTTWGTILLGVLGLFISIVFIQEPLGNFELLIRAAALWL